MATSTNKPRSSYFSPAELQILMTAYAESEHIFLLKINTLAAAKKRELAWEKKKLTESMREYLFEIYLRSFLLNVPLIQQLYSICVFVRTGATQQAPN